MMLEEKVIILLSGLDWDFICDYEKQTAIILAKTNKVFVFNYFSGVPLWKIILNSRRRRNFIKKLNSFKKNPSLFPVIYLLPFHRLKIINKINFEIQVIVFQLFIFIYSFLKKKEIVLWLFFPDQHKYIGKFKEKLSLYDCVDFHSSPDLKKDKIIKKQEKKLIRKVDFVFTNSPTLYRLKKNLHQKVFKVPQGFNSKFFLKAKKLKVPRVLKNIPPPRIGFIGNIDNRLDFKLIGKLAIKKPQWSFIFIGPPVLEKQKKELKRTLKRLNKLNNIFFLKKLSKSRIINYIDNFDVGFIPYNINQEFCRYCYPMKIFEFFARGKPVVATQIESLKPLKPYVSICKNASDFETEILKVIKINWSKKNQQNQRKLAKINSWKNKIKVINKSLLNNNY